MADFALHPAAQGWIESALLKDFLLAPEEPGLADAVAAYDLVWLFWMDGDALGGIPIKGARLLLADTDESGYVRGNSYRVADKDIALAVWRAHGEPELANFIGQAH